MKAAPFAYHRPESVKEAADMLAEFGDDAKVLAGGQSLVPMLAMRLTHFDNLIDISRVDELCGIDLDDGAVRVGATTSHALVGMDDEVADSVPLLTMATPHIGHFQIRTRGTLGGAIAHADPAAEYAAVALALGAGVVLGEFIGSPLRYRAGRLGEFLRVEGPPGIRRAVGAVVHLQPAGEGMTLRTEGQRSRSVAMEPDLGGDRSADDLPEDEGTSSENGSHPD